ncbi:MAG: division/cell wall cluster transcriptional repressor MraZ [Spirochaetales bacterium]|nr:division/cell wall cluster transcriptional repressor MraZ [Spirochaetales bacterium]
MFNPKVRKLQRALITPSVKVEFDNSGRLTIPQRLRAFANLEVKDNVLILGVGYYIEIWKSSEYEKYLDSLDESVSELSSSLFKENRENNK